MTVFLAELAVPFEEGDPDRRISPDPMGRQT
jgi:hypothetical protein